MITMGRPKKNQNIHMRGNRQELISVYSDMVTQENMYEKKTYLYVCHRQSAF